MNDDEEQRKIDGAEGLEILNNFNLYLQYYDELQPYMVKAIEEIKEKKNDKEKGE